MRNVWTALTLCTLLGGCNGDGPPYPRTEIDAQLFGPVAMRIHPIFTQIKDWTGDGKPDGIEALIELQDQFGDPTKASGRVIFELFEYRSISPERRGPRLVEPWTGYLETLDEQRDRWNRTSRTYSFQLSFSQIQVRQAYVLTAEFQLAGGGRFFDRVILEGTRAASRFPSPIPAATPPPTTSPDSATDSGAPSNAGPGPRPPQP